MRSGSRLSERWFTLALWLVAVVFAWFLIGLGSLVVGDLPQVEHRYTLEQFLDTDQARASAEALKQIRQEQDDNRRQVEQDRLPCIAIKLLRRAAVRVDARERASRRAVFALTRRNRRRVPSELHAAEIS